jgi:hypothetical protein
VLGFLAAPLPASYFLPVLLHSGFASLLAELSSLPVNLVPVVFPVLAHVVPDFLSVILAVLPVVVVPGFFVLWGAFFSSVDSGGVFDPFLAANDLLIRPVMQEPSLASPENELIVILAVDACAPKAHGQILT